MAQLRIYRPAKTAMQSGKKNTKRWVLEFIPRDGRFVDPIMGWTGSSDTCQQFRLKFESEEEAVAYAERKGLTYEVIQPHNPKTSLQSYQDNFTS